MVLIIKKINIIIYNNTKKFLYFLLYKYKSPKRIIKNVVRDAYIEDN